MSMARFLVGDVFDRMAELPDGSIDVVVTSPPFLALRSYLPDDHPHKGKEIGSEPTPAVFLDTMLALTAEWRRVLAPHGSICVELGDTYSGAGGYGSPDSPNPAYGAGRFEERMEGRTAKRYKKKNDGWPEAKSLCGIPSLYAWSIAYGRNLLNPAQECEPWRVRNLIAWVRPNPPVGALGDKCRPGTSYITVACVGDRRYFDMDAERVKSDLPPHTDNRGGHVRDAVSGRSRQVMNPVDENGPNGAKASLVRSVPTLGWTDCGHDTWRVGRVLDPFAGSGTTLAVAVGMGREAVGIDLDERNAHLAEQRVGMFLTVEA